MNKYILIFVASYSVTISCYAQTNTFPASGSVGIGTTTPSYKLDVITPQDSWKARFQGPDGYILLGPANAYWAHIYTDRPNFLFSAGLFSIPGNFSSYSSADLTLQTNGTNRMTITNGTGYVGIGTTLPNSKLVIADGNYGISINPSIAGGIGFNRNVVDGAIFNSTMSAWQFTARDDRFSLEGYNGSQHDLFAVLKNGNVGVGLMAPTQKLEVNGGILLNAENVAIGIDAQANARLGFIKKFGSWPVIASDNATPIVFSQTNQIGIHTNIAGATVTERMRIEVNGNVGIGTTSPDQKLTVNGTIHSKEVKVDMSVPGPDYVFEKDYDLPSLIELESYIRQNKHLPEVPSSKDMEKDGINLKEMNLILLKKMEEMTLHMIEMKKEINELKIAGKRK
jgi:hypothetical protein